jgi:hypothetical protein
MPCIKLSSGKTVCFEDKKFAPGGKTEDDNKIAFEGTVEAGEIKSGTKKRIDRVMPWEAPLKPGAWGGLDMRGMRSVTPDQQAAMDFATSQAEKNKIGKFYMDGKNYRLSNSDELEQQRLLESDTVMGASARAWQNTANNSPIMKAYQEGTGDAAKLVLGTAAGIAAAPAVVAGLGTIGTSAAAATSAPTLTSAAGNLLNAGFTGYEMYNAGKYGANAINDLAEGNLKDAGMNSLKAGTYALGAANAPLVQQAVGNAVVQGVSGYKETGDLGKAVVRGVGAGLTQKVLGDKGHHLNLNHSANEILSKYPTNALFKSITSPSVRSRALTDNSNLESNVDSNTPYVPSEVESTSVPMVAQLPKKEEGGKNTNMKNGINNPGFKSLPGFVQEKIVANMAMGGLAMPSEDDKIVKKGTTPPAPAAASKQMTSQQLANLATTFFSRDPSMQSPLPNFVGSYQFSDMDKTLMMEAMKKMKSGQGSTGVYPAITPQMIDQIRPMVEQNRTIDQPMEREMGGMNTADPTMSITDPDYEQMMLQYGGMVEDLDGSQVIQKFGKGGGITYRGQKFPGYNKPIKAPASDKHKKMVLVKKGDKIRLIKFGYSPKNKVSKSAKKDLFSPSYWSSK